MTALTRRPYPEREDCWHIYFGGVHVGTIARAPLVSRIISLHGCTTSIPAPNPANNAAERPPRSTK